MWKAPNTLAKMMAVFLLQFHREQGRTAGSANKRFYIGVDTMPSDSRQLDQRAHMPIDTARCHKSDQRAQMPIDTATRCDLTPVQRSGPSTRCGRGTSSTPRTHGVHDAWYRTRTQRPSCRMSTRCVSTRSANHSNGARTSTSQR